MAEGPVGEVREVRGPAVRVPTARDAAARPERKPARRLRPRWFSPLTRRILFVNTLPLFILVAGVLYLDDYRDSLIVQEIAALTTQGRIIAAALGEAAVSVIDATDDDPDASALQPRGLETTDRLAPDVARQILRRLVEPTHTRARLYDLDSDLVADSRVVSGSGAVVAIEPLAPLPAPEEPLMAVANAIYEIGRAHV